MRLAIFGATGGTGRYVVDRALAAGHSIRALVRAPDDAKLPLSIDLIKGNVLDAASVRQTVDSADAVLSCLGAKLGATFTRRGRIVAPGTAHIVEAMRSHGVRRLVAISTYGAGDSWPRLSPGARLLMRGLLWGELADKNGMEAVVRASGLDWTIVRPVNLKGGPSTATSVVDSAGQVGLGDWISRSDIAAFMLAALHEPDTIKHAYLLSGRA